ncbi:MAG: response regulator transcription factor [Bacteroidales bacterium]|nr:response regulator transcription factor [Bacteroidales bacterium]
MDKIKVMVVDDNNEFRRAIITLLNSKERYTVVGEATNGKEFLSMMEDRQADIVLMDIRMPEMDGIEATKLANQMYYPNLKVITLTMHNEFRYLKEMIEAGAKGFMLKRNVGKNLDKAVNYVMSNSMYLEDNPVY